MTLVMATAVGTSVVAQEKSTAAPTGKGHKCNPGCTSKKCNLVHGEKGHVCSDACKRSQKKA